MKKTEEWKTPKYYQRAWNLFSFGKAHLPFRGYCKKLKTKHQFKHISTTSYSWNPYELIENLECIGCHKQKQKILRLSQMKR